MKKKKYFRIIAAVLIVICTLALLQRLLTPKYVDDVIEGALIAEYYDEDKELIILPQQIRLPLLYARALTLITGKTPSATFGSRAYNVVGQNPLIKACKPETILRKLGQN